MKSLLSIVVALFMITSTVQAARHDRRQNRQGARIHQGVNSGELTKGEAHRARSQQRKIKRMENRMEADGMTPKEAARLEKAQDKASKNIYDMKHNDKQRPDGNPPAAPATETAPTE
jgi:hypothetical protein